MHNASECTHVTILHNIKIKIKAEKNICGQWQLCQLLEFLLINNYYTFYYTQLHVGCCLWGRTESDMTEAT